ncbi:MAG: DeoR/GlpR transcriptional regulator [Lentisphaeria bacterium]|nr:DeoR/GlpR transcriptional regulator [Lentisphaeria bacterium]
MNGHRLLTAERETRILQLLRGRRTLSVAEFGEELDVSEATIRRDLQSMADRGLLQRVRGGATLDPSSHVEPMFADKEGKQTAQKQAIAEAALALIEDRDVIYLDGGSTVLSLAQLLERRSDLTVVTNSLMAAAALMESGHRLILVGGTFRALSRTLVGPLTAPMIESLSVRKAFMGTIGFTVEDGLTTTDEGEAFTKTEIMRRADHVVLLADHTKLGLCSFARSEGTIDTLVTDRLESRMKDTLVESGVKIVLANRTK